MGIGESWQRMGIAARSVPGGYRAQVLHSGGHSSRAGVDMTAALLTLGALIVGLPLLIWADRDAQLDNMMSPEWVKRQASMMRHPSNSGAK